MQRRGDTTTGTAGGQASDRQASEHRPDRRPPRSPRLPARGLAWLAGKEAEGSAGDRLRSCGRAFAVGFNAYGTRGDEGRLAATLSDLPPDERGLAIEGAGMAACLAPGAASRLQRLLDGPGATHPYTAHVGAGWAAGFLGRAHPPGWERMHPLLRWLVLDGRGFCVAFFRRGRARRGVIGRARRGARWDRAHDQGVGRALWFVAGADPGRVAAMIDQFGPSRRGDLWSGVALAVVYAGGVGGEQAARVASLASAWPGDIALGAAFAAKARLLGGAVDDAADERVRALAACDLASAAAATDAALTATVGDGSPRDYLSWRAEIRCLLDPDHSPDPGEGDR